LLRETPPPSCRASQAQLPVCSCLPSPAEPCAWIPRLGACEAAFNATPSLLGEATCPRHSSVGSPCGGGLEGERGGGSGADLEWREGLPTCRSFGQQAQHPATPALCWDKLRGHREHRPRVARLGARLTRRRPPLRRETAPRQRDRLGLTACLPPALFSLVEGVVGRLGRPKVCSMSGLGWRMCNGPGSGDTEVSLAAPLVGATP
jgi:hypothetical protein